MRRKDFLRWMTAAPALAGAAAAPSAGVRTAGPTVFDPTRKHARDFAATGALKPISQNLYVYEDCSNVYILKQGNRAALINFGTGDVLKALPRIGAEKVERVFVTHHHRDAVQGLAEADYPFAVTVPRAEERFFEDAEGFWRDATIYINYDLRSHWNTPRRSIKVAGKVAGGDVVEWGGIAFHVIDTPGVTDGSVSYAARIDGKQVVFTGDLIAGAGKVNNWFDLHWGYYGFTQGIDASEKSFERVRAAQPEMLLPSHGAPMPDPETAMRENSRVYAALRQMLPPNSTGRTEREMRHILPHLLHLGGPACQSTGAMTTYVILADSGKALFYDYGYVDLDHIQKVKRQLGIKHAVVTFSHYHDDHLIRTYELMRDYGGIEIWVLDKMADVIENPTRYRLPCLIPFPMKPTRVVRDGERVEWEGYQLDFFHMPGQTEYHQGLATVIDGKKVMFTGDNTWKKKDAARIRNGPLVPHNEYFLDGGFITCAKRMLEYLPDIVCPAHTEEYSPTKEDLEGFVQWAYRLRDVMDGLILQPDPNFGMDYRWCHFYPVRHIAGKEEFTVELRLRNHLFRPGKVRVELKHSGEIACAEPVRAFTVEAKTEAAVPFRLRRTAGFGRRTVATADVTFNGRRLGEVTELVID